MKKTAIPELLEELDVKNAVVSIDAIACSTSVAQTIVQKEGDYVLSLKRNQRTLYEQVQAAFVRQKPGLSSDVWDDFGSERIEKRTAFVLNDLPFIDAISKWEGAKSILVIETFRELSHGKKEEETRFYISSLNLSADYPNRIVRSHWAIENKLHWQLDVSFHEDRSRVIKGNAPENMNCLRKIALQLITPSKGKQSVKSCRKIAGWNNNFLLEILKNLKI